MSDCCNGFLGDTCGIYKRPKLCNDFVLLSSRIQTNGKNTFKEQTQLNSVRNCDVIRFCFDSEIRKRVLGVRRVQNNQ